MRMTCRRRCGPLARRLALSAKAKDGAIVVLDKASAAEPKTKALLLQFGKLGFANALIVDGAEVDANFGLAARNIPNVDVLPVQGINVYDILRREKLVLTKAAVDALEARFK
jgi:large subunit ribosomal protein L4